MSGTKTNMRKRSRSWARIGLISGLVSGLALAIAGQACSGNFGVALLRADNSSIASSVEIEKIEGKALYDSKCSSCHGPIETSAKIGSTASRIASAIDSQNQMAGLKTLPVNDIRLISLALTSEIPVLTCNSASDVGHVTIHRLNNVEYKNTIRDLLGVTSDVTFPSDEYGGNFNNNARVLSITPTHISKYYDAAEAAVNTAFASATAKAKLISCNAADQACRSQVLSRFLGRAFRRPATSGELTTALNTVGVATAEGDSAEAGIKLAMTAALVSPKFLYRFPENPSPGDRSSTVVLSNYEIASRLSYFIWSSMPDDALFEAARLNQLTSREQMESQVRRMMKDAKASALIDGFAAQWLHLQSLDSVNPSTSVFPTFNAQLKADMKTETRTFMKDLFDRDGSFYELLTANYTFINDRLATNYGISGVSGSQFRKVSYEGLDRVGLVAHGSIMMLNANPDRTSIVKRGKWVLENLLCTAPPPPPPEVPGSLPESNEGLSNRERMELHRSNPTCFSCHAQMDPIGFALENFDPLGRYRTSDATGPIDNVGEFPDGRKFTGARELAQTVSSDKKFRLCVAEKLFTYSLGRQPESFDRCTINRIGMQAVAKDQPVSAAIIEMVNSDPFRMSRGE